jgi:hypothetical protein
VTARVALNTVLLFLPAAAQVKVDPATREGATAIRAFEDAVREQELRSTLPCRVQPLSPRLGLSFRYWSGFEAILPLDQFPEAESSSAVLFRVKARPAKNAPATEPGYFWEGLRIPAAGRRPKQGMISGGFYAGPGVYDIEWLFADPGMRACRARWSIQVKAKTSVTMIKPGAVEAVGFESWRGLLPNAAKAGPRATILMHAAPVWRGRNFVKLSSWDRMLLMSSLTSLLDLSGFSSVRLVAYDASGRRVLLKEDNFNQQAYRRLGQVLRETNYGLIDYKVLKDGPSEPAFLASLIEEDRLTAKPSDVIVFLGPELHGIRRLPPEVEALIPKLPKSYYIALAREPVSQGDVIHKLVKAAKGRSYLVLRNQDLLAPIRAMAQTRP